MYFDPKGRTYLGTRYCPRPCMRAHLAPSLQPMANILRLRAMAAAATICTRGGQAVPDHATSDVTVHKHRDCSWTRARDMCHGHRMHRGLPTFMIQHRYRCLQYLDLAIAAFDARSRLVPSCRHAAAQGMTRPLRCTRRWCGYICDLRLNICGHIYIATYVAAIAIAACTS